MNCKPGDLAVVIKSYSAANEGKVVRCIRLSAPTEWLRIEGGRLVSDGTQRAWVTEPMLRNVFGIEVEVGDGQLRPIRDPGEDARDETLDWKTVPSVERTKETA